MSEDKIVTEVTNRQRALNLIKSTEGTNVLALEMPTLFVQSAQVYATLELAEQQRIANLIALAQLRSELNEVDGQAETLASAGLWGLTAMKTNEMTGLFAGQDPPEEYPILKPEIAAALGIET